jgi:hypothetical protein
MVRLNPEIRIGFMPQSCFLPLCSSLDEPANAVAVQDGGQRRWGGFGGLAGA